MTREEIESRIKRIEDELNIIGKPITKRDLYLGDMLHGDLVKLKAMLEQLPPRKIT